MNPWLTYPLAFSLLALLPLLAFLFLWAGRKRQRLLAELGKFAALQSLVRVRPGARKMQTLCLFSGLVFLMVAIAGPRWGRDWSQAYSPTKDLVVVLDLSRSMLAEQPSRQERAIRALHDLVDALEEKGGYRTALVVFAAHAHLVFPLTDDLDHFRFVLSKVRNGEFHAATRPIAEDSVGSGTRIGAGLLLALESFPNPTSISQEILLISDGDDPARDDEPVEEWAGAVEKARNRNISLHVVGIGDPKEYHQIPQGGGFFQYQGKVVQTRLEEKPLEEMARRSQGIYLPARTQALPLGKLFLEAIANRPETDSEKERGGPPQNRPRYPWFLSLSLLFLTLTLFIREGLPRPRKVGIKNHLIHKSKKRPGNNRKEESARALALCLAILAVFLMGAIQADVEEWLRQGNAAFARGEFELALEFYEKAEPGTLDPGLVAFNKAAALYRLGNYPEAVKHYRRCLQDGQIPPERKARASYDLGNALFKHSQGESVLLLEEAIEAYLASGPLSEDARHNLELAKHYWHKARLKAPKDENKQKSDPNPKPPFKKGQKNGKEEANGSQTTQKNGKEKSSEEPWPKENKDKRSVPGALYVLPDEGRLYPLTPDQTAAALQEGIERIRQGRNISSGQMVQPSGNVKDW